MNILKSPQKVLILFLTVLVVLSFIMILRLEGKTALLQSRLDEHHKSLEKNKDVLDNLESFSRMIKNNGISIDGNKVTLQSGQSTITLQNNNINISSNGDIAIGTPTKSFVHIQKDGNIIIGPNNEKNLGYDKTEDLIYMLHNGSRVTLGKGGTSKRQGIRLISKTGGPRLSVYQEGIIITVPDKQGDYKISMAPSKNYIKISKDESVIKLENENINIEAKGDIEIGPNSEKNLGYDKTEDLIYMLHNGSRVTLGKGGTSKRQGIRLISKTGGPRLSVYQEGIIITVPDKQGDYKISMAPSKNYIKISKDESVIKLENENIDIEAKGDINITSKNGNVNINGKKVSLNE